MESLPYNQHVLIYEIKDQDLTVWRKNNDIQWKNRYPADKCPQNIHAIHQTEIYPLDSITYPLRNQVWMGKYLAQANVFYFTIQPNLTRLTSNSFI